MGIFDKIGIKIEVIDADKVREQNRETIKSIIDGTTELIISTRRVAELDGSMTPAEYDRLLNEASEKYNEKYANATLKEALKMGKERVNRFE